MATLETHDGGLYLPPELLGRTHPHAEFELEVAGEGLLLRPVAKPSPFWRTATAQQRADAFRRWATTPRPATAEISDEALRREGLYD